MLRRLHRDESGFALVTTISLLAIMSLLMIISLAAGSAVNTISERNSRWTKLLPVAEAGVNDALVRLTADRKAAATVTGCPYTGTATAGCKTAGGEYQVKWQNLSRGKIRVDAYGYYPTAAAYIANQRFSQARKVEIVMAPQKSFRYALFSNTTLDIKNNTTTIGGIFSNDSMVIENNAVVCGSIDNATGGVSLGNGAQIVKSVAGSNCDSEANVHSGGSISLGTTAVIQGNATASATPLVACPPIPPTLYSVTGGTVQGTATACGIVTSSTPNAKPLTPTAPPPHTDLPGFAFNAANYTDLTCFPSTGACGPANASSSAVSQFNTAFATTKGAAQGTYAIWQSLPTKNTLIDLTDFTLSGDLTIITNAPIDMGNANNSAITGTSGSVLAVIDLYVPPTGTTCSTKGGDCSIYGKNSIDVDAGDPNNEDDGVTLLLYTPGKMGFKNQGNEGEGALYAGDMDLKNGFDIVYNQRIERIVGFGTGLERTLWQELKP